MTTTPPLRIISVQEPPPTPRHGPAHDDFEPRFPTRSSQRIASREAKTTPEPQSGSRALRSVTTPESKRSTAQQSRYNLSPPISPQKSPKHNSAKRVQVLSPTSPSTRTRSHDALSSNPSFTSTSSHQQSFLSSSTVMSDSMLPTPVKTPRKNKKAASNVNLAARMLFQEQPTAGDDIMPTPKKIRKSTRHNGLSLGSFATADGAGTDHVQIFTDSRDNVPELDRSEDNPFVEHASEKAGPSAKLFSGTSKRRKLSIERKKDPQVEEAIKNDEGMVYVFRGKKVFKRFDDGSEEEETTVDPNDLGLLEHSSADADTLKLLKPMTRKSIRPTRLFQTEEQKRAREAEKAEEEVTDIDEEPSVGAAESSASTQAPSTNKRQSRRTTATSSTETPKEHTPNDTEHPKAEGTGDGESSVVGKTKTTKRGSPFDSWKRVKPGSSASTVAAGKGRKRTSSAMEEGALSSAGKKVKNR
ncbi:hypothetical protein EPUS_08674 [Endocarpon pusillum Z07020]|uniref:Uncharacterized protein n=1 Tax=Endocarpon pusillum (strain Z07020 / HMAS-L-300199) TaxID=1263415 RepID=U1GHE8_ENDPU|nr:uncharacterized protein EPUS_08674 [Endocarpon pusillum Z07020]ERF77107.1 hypothetical protein EPUS_08674 [Endocarpon pusillum Z07020]